MKFKFYETYDYGNSQDFFYLNHRNFEIDKYMLYLYMIKYIGNL